MKTYKNRPLERAPAPQSETVSPLAGGMPSLVDGASRKDLPEAMRAKMENAFGADFSNLNIYESEKVAEGGAKAVTQGNTIAFAPGEFNVYSPSSEALLGHELSHVVSQARGESRGNGLLTDSYLEAKADREGVMAAAGQQVYSGPITPLSNSSPMSVAGPMQCKRNQGDDEETHIVDVSNAKTDFKPSITRADMPEMISNKPKEPGFLSRTFAHLFRRRGYNKATDLRGRQDVAMAQDSDSDSDDDDILENSGWDIPDSGDVSDSESRPGMGEKDLMDEVYYKRNLSDDSFFDDYED